MASMATDYESVRREVDTGLGTIGRLRIIARLGRNPDKRFTVYGISAMTHLKRSDVRANLSHLVEIGWVRKFETTPTTYQMNLSNEAATKLVDFLRSVGYL
jgi:Fic family protein